VPPTPCGQCGHDALRHVLLATTAAADGGPDLEAGGIRLCPDGECTCYATWRVGMTIDHFARPSVAEPDAQRVAELRARIQGRARP
jgi:hypothetical protein